jgi:glycosyltransferase involved in cell wall biosynthesis
MLAIVSTNKQKYSETFIHNHLQFLDNTILYLFDGYLPQKFSLDKGITEYPVKNRYSFSSYSEALKKLLKKNNVSVILAEYGPSGVAMMNICAALNVRLVVHFHGYDAYRDDVLNEYHDKYKILFQIASDIVVVSENMKQQLIRLGCPVNKIRRIYYGIDTAIFTLNNNNKRSKHQFVSCGRFVPKKAPHLTIDAFNKVYQEFTHSRLVMIGDGELLEVCKKKVNELGLSSAISFTGSLTSKEIADVFDQSVCFVQHSVITEDHDSEGTPLAILEAMASGLPVVSTMHGGIPEVVKDGVNGFLVNEYDVDSMAEKMKAVLSDLKNSYEIGEANANYTKSHFSLESYIEKLKLILFV